MMQHVFKITYNVSMAIYKTLSCDNGFGHQCDIINLVIYLV